MSKAKTASKNNPTAREQARKFLFNGQEVKPVKLIGLTTTFFAAEYESGDLALAPDGSPIPWKKVKSAQTRV